MTTVSATEINWKYVSFGNLNPWVIQERPEGVGCPAVPREQVPAALVQAVQTKDSACVYDLLYGADDLETKEMEPALKEAMFGGNYEIFFSLVLRCTSKPACRLEASKSNQDAKKACLMTTPISYELVRSALYNADYLSFRNLLEHIDQIDRKNMFKGYVKRLLKRILEVPVDAYVKDLPGKLFACLDISYFDLTYKVMSTTRPRASLVSLSTTSLKYLQSLLVSYPLEEVEPVYIRGKNFSRNLYDAFLDMMDLNQLSKVRSLHVYVHPDFSQLLYKSFARQSYSMFEFVLEEIEKTGQVQWHLRGFFYRSYEGIVIAELQLKMDLILANFSKYGLTVPYEMLKLWVEQSPGGLVIPAAGDLMAKHALQFDVEMTIHQISKYTREMDKTTLSAIDAFIKIAGPKTIREDFFKKYMDYFSGRDPQSNCNFLGLLIRNKCPISWNSFYAALDIDCPIVFEDLIIEYANLANALSDDGNWTTTAGDFFFHQNYNNLPALGRNFRILQRHGYKIHKFAGYVAANEIKTTTEPGQILKILSTIFPLSHEYLGHAKDSLDYFRGRLYPEERARLPEIQKIIGIIMNTLMLLPGAPGASNPQLPDELIDVITELVLKLYAQGGGNQPHQM